MIGIDPEVASTEKDCIPPNGGEDHSSALPVAPLDSSARKVKPDAVIQKLVEIRRSIVESGLFSTRLFLLAMPIMGMAIQCGLFLFGKTCSPFPMWISFLVFSALALLIHWKMLARFWGLVFLGVLLTAYTFPYCRFVDPDSYHVPMQVLLREGWNPVFDSTLEKFGAIVNRSSLLDYHTLFLPKTVALCGALVARSTGLWIAGSFLGYLLFFVLFKTAFVFAKAKWNLNAGICWLFALSVSFSFHFAAWPTMPAALLDGFLDSYTYSAMMISLFSLLLYLQQRKLHDLVLAVAASAICSTLKTTGLINCVLLWGLFGLYSWKHKETYWGIFVLALLVAWIGMSPLVTSWIQYGSPFYPTMSFDPNIEPVDITSDFIANADGERMGYVARFVYAWISPDLAAKACAIYYRKPDFNPDFYVPFGVDGFGKPFNFLFCLSIVLLISAKKDFVSIACCYILVTLVLCPVKYIGYVRYFPQAWAVAPLAVFQFCSCPPAWLANRQKLKRVVSSCFYLGVCVVSAFLMLLCASYQIRQLIMEGKRQKLLASFQKAGVLVEIPQNSKSAFTVSSRLACENVRCYYSFNERKVDFKDTDSYPHYKQYFQDYWSSIDEYQLNKNPSRILKLLDIFKFFPHPLMYRSPNAQGAPVPAKTPPDNQDQPE